MCAIVAAMAKQRRRRRRFGRFPLERKHLAAGGSIEIPRCIALHGVTCDVLALDSAAILFIVGRL